MSRTIAQLKARLPNVLVDIILLYFRATEPTIEDRAEAGEYEACERAKTRISIEDALTGACIGGHIEIARLMISRGATGCFNHPIMAVCRQGDLAIARLLSEIPCVDFGRGFLGACEGGQVECARLMLDHLVSDFGNIDYIAIGFGRAILNGHSPVARLLIARGFMHWGVAMRRACQDGHVAHVATMLDAGIDPMDAFPAACVYRQPAIAQLLIDRGVTKCPICPRPVAEHATPADKK